MRVTLLLIENRQYGMRPKRDLGEAEAVVQATEIDASMVLVDDPLGRSWADRHSLENHGLIWILRQLRQFGAINEVGSHMRKLRSISYRLPAKHVRDLPIEFEEG